jgi:hypothetical protein
MCFSFIGLPTGHRVTPGRTPRGVGDVINPTERSQLSSPKEQANNPGEAPARSGVEQEEEKNEGKRGRNVRERGRTET